MGVLSSHRGEVDSGCALHWFCDSDHHFTHASVCEREKALDSLAFPAWVETQL